MSTFLVFLLSHFTQWDINTIPFWNYYEPELTDDFIQNIRVEGASGDPKPYPYFKERESEAS